MSVYHRVVFNRGAGLGNRLFPWARCVVAAEQSGGRMLAPRWSWPVRFASGMHQSNFLHHGLLFGIFEPRPAEVTGLTRLRIELRGGAEIHEGDGPKFRGLAPDRDRLRDALRASVRPRWLEAADAWRGVPIGMHVRLGDFKAAKTASDYFETGALRTPLDWFIDMLRVARKQSGNTAPAIVVSDGSAADLEKLLAEPAVNLVSPSSPASDMLALSSCRLILGSGGSSFSGWAAFLGDVPIFTIPGQSLSWFGLDEGVAVVGTCDPAKPDDEFLRAALTLSR